MLIISLATACTVLTLNLSKRGDEGNQVPKILQFIFFDIIAKVLFINLKSNIKSNLSNPSRHIYQVLMNDFQKIKHQLIYMRTNEIVENNSKKYELLNNFMKDCCNKHNNNDYYTNIKSTSNTKNVLVSSTNKLSNKTKYSESDACRIATDSRLLLRASPLISIRKREEESLILTSDRSSSKFNLENCEENLRQTNNNNYSNETTTYESIECCVEKRNKSRINQKNISSTRTNYFNNRAKTNKDPMRKSEFSSCNEKRYSNKIRKLRRVDKNNILRDRNYLSNENRSNLGFSRALNENTVKIRQNIENDKRNKSGTSDNLIDTDTNEHIMKRLINKLNENLERNELNDAVKEYKSIIKSQWVQLSHVVDALFCYLFVLSTFFLYIYLLYQLP